MDWKEIIREKVVKEATNAVPGVFDNVKTLGSTVISFITKGKNIALFLGFIGVVVALIFLGLKLKEEQKTGKSLNILAGLAAVVSKLWSDFISWITGKKEEPPKPISIPEFSTTVNPTVVPIEQQPMADGINFTDKPSLTQDKIEYSIIPEFQRKEENDES